MSSGQPPAGSENIPSDNELAALAALIASDHPDESVADKNIDKLLQQLESAETVMRGMEGRLDSLLETFDSLIDSLEGSETESSCLAHDKEKGKPEEPSTSSDSDAPQQLGSR